jgi:hypothetical protein
VSAFPDEKGTLLEMDETGHYHLLPRNKNGWIGGVEPSPDGKRFAYVYTSARKMRRFWRIFEHRGCITLRIFDSELTPVLAVSLTS